VKFGLIFIMVYLVQAIIGMAIAFALIYTIMPDLFAGIGLLPPLAFGMNPGLHLVSDKTGNYMVLNPVPLWGSHLRLSVFCLHTQQGLES
jgi:hypothetical protein